MNPAYIEDLFESIGLVGGQRNVALVRQVDERFDAQRTVEMNVKVCLRDIVQECISNRVHSAPPRLK